VPRLTSRRGRLRGDGEVISELARRERDANLSPRWRCCAGVAVEAVRLPRSFVEVLEVAMQERRWLVAAPALRGSCCRGGAAPS
jgi:hypothetical protein